MITFPSLLDRVQRGEIDDSVAVAEFDRAFAGVTLEPDQRTALLELCFSAAVHKASDPDTTREGAFAMARFVHALALRYSTPSRRLLIGETAYIAGCAARRAGQPHSARRWLELAARELESDVPGALAVTAELVNVLADIGELRLAASRAEVWHARAVDAGIAAEQVSARYAQGVIANRRGAGAAAVAHYRAATALRDALSEHERQSSHLPSVADLHLALGKSSRQLGLYEEAMVAFERARDAHDHDNNGVGVATCLSEIGFTCGFTGETARAASYLADAAERAHKLERPDLVAHWQQLVRQVASGAIEVVPRDASAQFAYEASVNAAIALRAGRTSGVEACLQSLVDWALSSGHLNIEVAARANYAGALELGGQSFLAALKSRSAGRRARRGGDAVSWLEAQANFVHSCIGLREVAHRIARSVAVETLAHFDTLLADTTSSEFRQQIRAGQARMVEGYALLLHVAGDHAALIEITERARAQNLGGWIRARSALDRAPIDAAARDHLDQQLRALRSVEVEAESMHATRALAPGALRDHRATRERLLDALRADPVGRELDATRVAASRGGEALDAARSVLDGQPGACVLYLFGLDPGVIATIVRRRGEEVDIASLWLQWPRAQRHAAITQLTQVTLPSPGERGMRSVVVESRAPDGTRNINAPTEHSGDPLARIREAFAPLRKAISPTPDRIAIIPHRELQLVPYELALEVTDAECAITLAPSCAVLRECLQRPMPKAGDVLMIGDPTGTLRYALRETAVPGGGEVPTAVDLDALERVARDAAVIHFASHGIFNPDNPYHSGVIVSPGTAERADDTRFVSAALKISPPAGEPAFRLLTVQDILSNLDLRRSPLVILSACVSGVARLHAADEQTGLPSAFLVAGARTVIATLRRVRDDVALLMMQELYQHRALSPPVALQRARASVRAMPRAEVLARLGPAAAIPDGDPPFAAPLLTAPFQCYGAW